MMWGKDKEEDRLKSDVLKREVKSLGFSSPSCKHTWSFSDRPLLSGITVYSAIWRQIKILEVSETFVSQFETLKILKGAFSYLWFLSINLIHLNAVRHEPLQDNILKRWVKRGFCPYLSFTNCTKVYTALPWSWCVQHFSLTMILLFSSLSMYWSLKMWQEPTTASLPASYKI